MREPVKSRKFETEFARAVQRGLDPADWEHLVYFLLKHDVLPMDYDEHFLHGWWKGYLECHLAGDLLVIYRRTPSAIIFKAIGTHKELFKDQPRSYAKEPKQRPKGFGQWPFSQ